MVTHLPTAPERSRPAPGTTSSTTRRSRIFALLLVPTAGAIAVGLFALRLHFEPPTIPRYTLTATTADAPKVLRPGDHFDMTLLPARHTAGAVGARGFLLRGDHVRPWAVTFVVSNDGSVRLDGAVDVLFAGVPPGDWQVAIAVGRPEVLPTAPADILRARRSIERGEADPVAAWRLVLERVRLGT